MISKHANKAVTLIQAIIVCQIRGRKIEKDAFKTRI